MYLRGQTILLQTFLEENMILDSERQYASSFIYSNTFCNLCIMKKDISEEKIEKIKEEIFKTLPCEFNEEKLIYILKLFFQIYKQSYGRLEVLNIENIQNYNLKNYKQTNSSKTLCINRHIIITGKIDEIENEIIFEKVTKNVKNINISLLENIKKIITECCMAFSKISFWLILKSKFNKNFSNDNNNFILEIEKYEVVDYLFCISKKFLKHIFTYKQFNILKTKIKTYIYAPYKEMITIYQLSSFFDIKNCKFFKMYFEKEQVKYTRMENIANEKIFKNFIQVLFESFFAHAINQCFYVSIKSGKDLTLHFYYKNYLKSTYELKCNAFLQNSVALKQKNVCKHEEDSFTINDEEFLHDINDNQNKIFNDNKNVKFQSLCVNESKNTTFCTLRILHKNDENWRVIANCQKINKEFLFLVSFLRTEIKANYKNALFGFYDLNNALLEFYKNNNENVYVYAFDLNSCFDFLDHNFLISAFKDLMQKTKRNKFRFHRYRIFKYNESLECVFNKIINIYRQEDLEDECFSSLHKKYVKTVELTKDEIFNLFIDAIKNVKIKKGNDFYLKTVGILQGLSSSIHLCTLYMEKIKEKYFSWIEKGTILTYVDDFIYLTSSKEEFLQFKIFMKTVNFKEIKVNKEKSQYTPLNSLNSLNISDNTKQKNKLINYKIRGISADILQTHPYKSFFNIGSITNLFKFNLLPEGVSLNNNFVNTYKNKITDKYVTWVGYRIYFNGFSIKYDYDWKNIKNQYSLRFLPHGKCIFTKVKCILDFKLNSLLFHGLNKKKYENAFELILYITRVSKHLISNLDTVNLKFIDKIIDYALKRINKKKNLCMELLEKMRDKIYRIEDLNKS
ncbi:hypothetical protein EHP00_886 [Ecytonucleospora hepatopenaei]|uniref:Telomerase reverse transcriptase n=1 Tax=Ecytonucleospora hepatopenaei TaxID=646526 RepID=A0A1W0E3Z1_9MICR|nr:hypothetical protein EHP00_886 [Ecytonucleospora hepatopenaei]